jgi:hypothetical protein
MKKLTLLFLISIMFCFATAASGQDWITANQISIAWDAVTNLENGDPIPPGSTIKYQVWIRREGQTTATQTGGESEATQGVVTFNSEGRFFIGVEAIRYENDQVVARSSITWSDSEDAEAVPSPFGVIYYLAPQSAKNLRRATTQ